MAEPNDVEILACASLNKVREVRDSLKERLAKIEAHIAAREHGDSAARRDKAEAEFAATQIAELVRLAEAEARIQEAWAKIGAAKAEWMAATYSDEDTDR